MLGLIAIPSEDLPLQAPIISQVPVPVFLAPPVPCISDPLHGHLGGGSVVVRVVVFHHPCLKGVVDSIL